MAEEFDRNAARIDALERLFEQRFSSSQEAIKTALVSNDRRLDGMNEFRQSLNDMTAKMITRSEALGVLDAIAQKSNAATDDLRNRLEVASRPNYFLFIGVISMLFTLITGIWLVIGLKIET